MSADATLLAYASRLFARTPSAVVVPSAPATVGEWSAAEHECHANVAHWCSQHPEDSPAPGWLYFSFNGLFDYVRFTAHSVIRRSDGQLLDITPSQAFMLYPFLPAEESTDAYYGWVTGGCVAHLDLYIDENRVQVFGWHPS